MSPRIKLSTTVMFVATLIITGAVVAVSLLSRKLELYTIGVNLLAVGTTLTALTIPLFYRSHHSTRTHIQLHLPIEERNRLVSDPYYDYFAGVAFAPIATAILGFLLILLANSFGQRTASNTSIPFVGSVRPSIMDMQEIAHKYYKDAYLVGMTYNFAQQEDDILSAEFATSADSFWLLVIKLDIDGKYVEKTYDLSSSISQQKPITEEDWPIDSQEAVSIFAQDDDIKACINFPQSRKKILELTRSLSTQDNDVKWCLRIEECEAIRTTTCINAATGEKIALE